MIEKEVLERLKAQALTIAFAESMTGGGCAYHLILNAGASEVISGSIVTYSLLEKVSKLKISEDFFKTHSVVSKATARQMAKAAHVLFKADIGVGVTGNAGPSLQAKTSTQEVFISVYWKEEYFDIRLDLEKMARKTAIEYTIQKTFEQLKYMLFM